MVAAAQRSRAPIQRMADQVAGWFVPAVIAVALATFAAWLLWGPSPALPYALVTSVAVLIIACPCALGLATPMSIMVGVGRGAQHGVLIRDAEALERMEKVDTLVVDKTGTLTEGRPRVVQVEPAPGFRPDDVLQKLASVERASEHPLALAIVAAARERELPLADVADFDSPVGKGVAGKLAGVELVSGAAKFLAERGIDVSPLQAAAEEQRARSATVVFVAWDGRLAGFVAIADPIKPTTPAALHALRQAGVRIVMLTGDGRTTALAVARELGNDEVVAEVFPEDKARIVQRLRGEGRVVAMAGDRVNGADRGGRSVPLLRLAALAGHRRGGHGPVLRQRDRQCAAAADRAPGTAFHPAYLKAAGSQRNPRGAASPARWIRTSIAPTVPAGAGNESTPARWCPPAPGPCQAEGWISRPSTTSTALLSRSSFRSSVWVSSTTANSHVGPETVRGVTLTVTPRSTVLRVAAALACANAGTCNPAAVNAITAATDARNASKRTGFMVSSG